MNTKYHGNKTLLAVMNQKRQRRIHDDVVDDDVYSTVCEFCLCFVFYFFMSCKVLSLKKLENTNKKKTILGIKY